MCGRFAQTPGNGPFDLVGSVLLQGRGSWPAARPIFKTGEIMKRIIVDAAALDAIVRDVEHNCSMLALADEESAADDVEFYVPEIQRAADRLRGLIREAEQARTDNFHTAFLFLT